MPEAIYLCGVDDAVFKEHAGAIAAHHGRVSHFEDDPCTVCLTCFRQRLLRGRTFCGSKAEGLVRSHQIPNREDDSGPVTIASP